MRFRLRRDDNLAVIARLTGSGSYPWHRDAEDTSGIVLLGGVEPRIVAWMVIGTAALGLAVTGTMFTLARRPGQGLGLLRVTASLSALMGIVLSVVAPDFRLLRNLAYLPVLIVMTVLGMDTGALWATAFEWPVVNLMILTLGGVVFLAAAVDQWRLATYACQRCGRADRVAGGRRPTAPLNGAAGRPELPSPSPSPMRPPGSRGLWASLSA